MAGETVKIEKTDIQSHMGFLVSGLILGALAICVNSGNTLRIPGLVLERGIGTEAQSSVILSAMMITSIVGGVGFGWLNQFLKEKMSAVCMLAYAAGMILIAGSGNIIILGIGAMIAGAAQNLIVTALFNDVSNKLPANLVKIGTTFVLVGCNLGSSCSAILLKVIGLFSEKMSASFMVYAVVMLALGLLMMGRAQMERKTGKK